MPSASRGGGVTPPAFWKLATSGAVVRRSCRVAAIVGVVLAFLNHGDRILGGSLDPVTILKISMTFLVPFSVSTWASVRAQKDLLMAQAGNEFLGPAR